MSVQGLPGLPRHWAKVLDMPEGELRLTTATAQYKRLMMELDPIEYAEDELGYQKALDELGKAYDQACRELGNPG